MGSVIIAWTIRISISLFFGTLIAWVLQFSPARLDRALRVLWTVGFVLFVAHVLAAFHFHHNWNHAAAVEPPTQASPSSPNAVKDFCEV